MEGYLGYSSNSVYEYTFQVSTNNRIIVVTEQSTNMYWAQDSVKGRFPSASSISFMGERRL